MAHTNRNLFLPKTRSTDLQIKFHEIVPWNFQRYNKWTEGRL